MRRPVKIILIIALLSCAAIGLRHVRGQGEVHSKQSGVSAAGATNRLLKDSAVHVNGGSFVLKNLTLTKMTGSTVLKGDILNKTNRKQEQVFFEIRAYNREGKLLQGMERKTIFAVQQVKGGASVPVNHGHGVWLQGIPLNEIVRLEVYETSDDGAASLPSWTSWAASHAVVTWEKDSEIEE